MELTFEDLVEANIKYETKVKDARGKASMRRAFLLR